VVRPTSLSYSNHRSIPNNGGTFLDRQAAMFGQNTDVIGPVDRHPIRFRDGIVAHDLFTGTPSNVSAPATRGTSTFTTCPADQPNQIVDIDKLPERSVWSMPMPSRASLGRVIELRRLSTFVLMSWTPEPAIDEGAKAAIARSGWTCRTAGCASPRAHNNSASTSPEGDVIEKPLPDTSA